MILVVFDEVKCIVNKVIIVLGGCGIFGVEFFVKGDKVWFSEVLLCLYDIGFVMFVF